MVPARRRYSRRVSSPDEPRDPSDRRGGRAHRTTGGGSGSPPDDRAGEPGRGNPPAVLPGRAGEPASGDPLADQLAAIVGPEHVLTDPDLRAGYEIDWTRRFAGRARLVVRPGSTAEVARVVRACATAAASLVPQGGNTGLVGGGVPRDGEVLLSLRRLDQLGRVDAAAMEVTAGAGVTLARLQARASEAGLAFGIDLAARDSATVGGMIATNAGGVHVLRHGPMRAQVVGIEAVLASGDVLSRMPGLPKDNAGYALPQLLAGSEGTLAVITGARLRLVPAPAHRAVALVALATGPDHVHAEFRSPEARATASAVALTGRARARLASLEAAELFFEDGLALVLRHRGGERPFRDDHAGYLLLECAADADPAGGLAELLAGAPEVADAVLVSDPSGRRRLWDLREDHTDAIAAEGIAHKLDVSVPVARLAELVERLPGAVAGARGRADGARISPGRGSRPGPTAEQAAGAVRLVTFGHVGDGNLHVNLLGPAPDDDAPDDAVLGLVAELGGSISAEHGVGIAKRRWLGLSRAAVDIAAMRAIKRALDPAGLLNPGVLFEDGAR